MTGVQTCALPILFIQFPSHDRKVEGSSSQSYKMGEYGSVISRLKSFSLKGLSSQAKLDKYRNIAESCGFVISQSHVVNAGFDGRNSGVLDFCIDFESK